jgi:hypothetical protein
MVVTGCVQRAETAETAETVACDIGGCDRPQCKKWGPIETPRTRPIGKIPHSVGRLQACATVGPCENASSAGRAMVNFAAAHCVTKGLELSSRIDAGPDQGREGQGRRGRGGCIIINQLFWHEPCPAAIPPIHMATQAASLATRHGDLLDRSPNSAARLGPWRSASASCCGGIARDQEQQAGRAWRQRAKTNVFRNSCYPRGFITWDDSIGIHPREPPMLLRAPESAGSER